MRLEDGTGTGYQVKVDSTNRLEARSIAESEAEKSAFEGNAYNINTGFIAFTGDGTLIYVYNDEDRDIFIESIALGNDGSGTHSARPYITIIRNPTGGDLISDATAVDMNVNRNFRSSKTLSTTTLVYKGKVSGTITGGADLGILNASTAGRDFYTINMVLGRGSSLAIKLTANLSSGTANIYCALIAHLKEEGL